MAVGAVLCRRRGWVLPPLPAPAGAALGGGSDHVLRAQPEPTLSVDDGDDRAAISGVADLAGTDHARMRRCAACGQYEGGERATDTARCVDLRGGTHALRRL